MLTKACQVPRDRGNAPEKRSSLAVQDIFAFHRIDDWIVATTQTHVPPNEITSTRRERANYPTI